MLRYLLALVLMLVALPALAQKRATFITGTFVENAQACERLKDFRSGKPGIAPLAAPGTLTSTGVADGASRCSFKSISVKRPGVRWRVVLACDDDGIPAESTVDITRKGKDQLVLFLREAAIFWPAELGRGLPVPGRPNVRVIREQVTQTETWQRCRP